MRVRGDRKGEEMIARPKKDLDIKNNEDKAIILEDLIYELGIDNKEFANIFANLILNNDHHIYKRLDSDEQYKYLHKIIFQLAAYGFQFKDIAYIFQYAISPTIIGKWVKQYREESLKIKPIQVFIPLDQDCVGEDQPWSDVLNKNTEKLLQVMLQHKIYLHHSSKPKFLTIKDAKNLKRVLAKK